MPISIETNRQPVVDFLEGHGACLYGTNRFGDVKGANSLTEIGLERPNKHGVGRVGKTSFNLSRLKGKQYDFVMLHHSLPFLSNPIQSLIDAVGMLKPAGYVYLSINKREVCQDKFRPVTSLEHLIADYSAKTVNICDEHQLAFVYAWNQGLFPDPYNVSQVLEYMWENNLINLDKPAKKMINKANFEVFEEILSANTDYCVQHVFDLPRVIELFDFVNSKSGYDLIPIHVAMTKGLLSEHAILFQNIADGERSEDVKIARREEMLKGFEALYKLEQHIENTV